MTESDVSPWTFAMRLQIDREKSKSLGMQEAQYGAPGVRELMGRVAKGNVFRIHKKALVKATRTLEHVSVDHETRTGDRVYVKDAFVPECRRM